MTETCGAVFACVVSVGLVAAPAFTSIAEAQDAGPSLAGVFELSPELDADVLFVAGDGDPARDGPYIDLSLRLNAEAVTEGGLRWGVDAEASAGTGDGRRGFSRTLTAGPASAPAAGALTGLSVAPDIGAADPRILVREASVFIKTGWGEARAGLGDTAAVQARPDLPGAFRLAAADGGRVDPTGLALADTGLTLAEGAPRVLVQSRRLIGLQLSASYAPSDTPCVQACRPAPDSVLRATLEDIWSVGVSFDRRAPATGVRWRASAGYEAASAVGPWAGLYDQPWAASARAVREAGGVTLAVSGLTGSEGYASSTYTSVSAAAVLEQGDWLFSVETACGDSALFDARGCTGLLGASVLVGSRGVIGVGLLAAEAREPGDESRAAAIVLEAGLRF